MSTDSSHYTQTASYASPPITIILTILLLVFFFLGIFSIYFCKCFMESISNTWQLRRSPSGTPIGRSGSTVVHGLDPSIIESFPKFTYSNVKDLRQGKCDLECAICLSEFGDDDLLRLLTVCCHVFHQECIDLWLSSHKTCPVCRRSLDAPEKLPEKSPVVNNAMPEIDEHEDQSTEDSFRIVIKEEDTTRNIEEEDNRAERFSRSHTTGHSIVRIKGEEDRYTLRLPEHVEANITRGTHNWTKSCTTFEDYSSNAASSNGGGFGEVSGISGGNINKV